MKKLLVGSVFASDDPIQRKWLDLQLKFLAATTSDFDHVAVVMEKPATRYFFDRTQVIVPGPGEEHPHLRGLRTLLSRFQMFGDQYEGFLFLDSDAFPVKRDWQRWLDWKMRPTYIYDDAGFALCQQTKQYEIAVILRPENFETRLHASVLFARPESLERLSFEYGHGGTDLLGNNEGDIHIPVYQTDRRRYALPLLRSNRMNVHPLACGIYYDMFYHHCCGSGRPMEYRSKKYWEQFVQIPGGMTRFTTELFTDPSRFVSNLAGWSDSEYARGISL